MRLSLFFLTSIFLIAGMGSAQTTWFVDDDAPNDPGPNDPLISDPLEDGSANHPFDMIQEGIDHALDGDTVLVAPGTYIENVIFPAKEITVKSDQGPGVTFIDGNQAGSTLTFEPGGVVDSVLDGFSIVNGYAEDGGGIHCWDSDATIINNTITQNHAVDSGGGINCLGSDASITENTITGNTTGVYGGGIKCQWGNETIMGNMITDNTASLDGGGIHCFSSHASITYNTIKGNIACRDSGGISCKSSDVVILNNVIEMNTGGSFGGGILCSGEPVIKNNRISDNTARTSGGGIFCSYGKPIIMHNAVLGNRADGKNGGGICCLASTCKLSMKMSSWITRLPVPGGIYADQGIIITNNIIANNSADLQGGGIWADHELMITNNTIVGNTANNDGGGIYYLSGIHPNIGGVITNTICWDNYALRGPELCIDKNVNTSDISIEFSDLKGGLSSVFVEAGCNFTWGSGMIDADPLFVSGPDGDFYLSQIAAG